jgi:SAM-dependent methyltransferase
MIMSSGNHPKTTINKPSSDSPTNTPVVSGRNTLPGEPFPEPGGSHLYDCRFCGSPLFQMVVDLGKSPLCESYLSEDQLNSGEMFYPIQAFVCSTCFLVQVPELVSGEDIYSHYAYFSSYSDSWLRHAERYSEMIIDRFSLDTSSRIIEIASNDGYLLQYFKARDFSILGVEPAANIAEVAVGRGIPTVNRFFGRKTAEYLVESGQRADLLIGNNVLAHVPDLNDFVAGLKVLLAPDGVITMEFSHLVKLMEGNQFDQIYQEHYCYFSLIAVEQVFAAHDLILFDVEEIDTHGGSLRIYARHRQDGSKPVLDSVTELREKEIAGGLKEWGAYRAFSERVVETKHRLLEFLIRAKREGKTIVGYGAPGKGSTLLNYCGIRGDFLDYTVDRSTYKQGKYLPGVHIPIFAPEKIKETKPDYILILPWNLKDEIRKQLSFAKEWGGEFVVPIPELEISPA